MAALSTIGILAAGGLIGAAGAKALAPKQKAPAIPTLPDAPNAATDEQAAQAAATQAVTEQRRKAREKEGRRATLLTTPQTLGEAPVRRSTLLGV